jgi:hypothetical protein
MIRISQQPGITMGGIPIGLSVGIGDVWTKR